MRRSLLNFMPVIMIVIFLMTFGCASTKNVKPAGPDAGNIPATAALAPEEAAATNAPEGQGQQKPDEELFLPPLKKEMTSKPLPPAKVEHVPVDVARVAHVQGDVVLNAESMPLSDFVVYALGETLRVTFFMDEAVMGMKTPVTLRMTQAMPAEKALDVVIGFFEKNDLDVEERGGALYIMKPKPKPAQPPTMNYRIGRQVEESPGGLVQFVPLKYLRAPDNVPVLLDLFKDVQIKPYYKENAYMFSGSASAIKEVVDFLNLIDVPTLREKKLFLSRITYWQPDDFIKQISTILEGVGIPVGKGPGEPGISFIPIKYLNSVLIVSPDDAALKFVFDWKKRLDNAEAAGTEEKVFTFSPQYSKASDLVDSIRKLYGVIPGASGQQAKGVAGGPVTSAVTAAASTFSAGPAAPAAVPTPTMASVAPVSASAAGAIPGLKISSDDRRNVVIIISTPAIYKSLLSLLGELDKPPKQVLIEATIAELTLTDDLSYGLEWYLQTRNKASGTSNSLTTLGQLGLSTSEGLLYKFVSDSQRLMATVNAFAQQNKVNILSTPRIMVLDNQTATLNVGSQVPILGGQTTTSTVEGSTVNAQVVTYITTGITVSVTPTINTEGLLTLQISVTDSQAVPNSTSSINSPLITNDSLTTSIVATTSETILLGGMMSDSVTDSENKVPLVGDIPLIGNLFKTRSKAKTKTELIIMMTPKILTSGEAASKVTDEIKRGLKWME